MLFFSYVGILYPSGEPTLPGRLGRCLFRCSPGRLGRIGVDIYSLMGHFLTTTAPDPTYPLGP